STNTVTNFGDVAPAPGPLLAMGASLDFVEDDGANAPQLWSTSGFGAQKLTHIPAPAILGGTTGDLVDPSSSIGSLGARVFFVASDGTSGYELWKTEPAVAAGAVRVSDIASGPASSTPRLTGEALGLLF